jgi:hypothetical protein
MFRDAARARRARLPVRPTSSRRERQPPEQRVEERRLAASIQPDECEPLAPRDLEAHRPEAERSTLDDRLLEPHDDVAAPGGRREPEPQLPRLVRLVHAVEVAELLRVRLLDVLRLLLLAALPVTALLPLLHAPRLHLDALLLRDVALPALVVAGAPPLALRLVLAPTARIFGRTVCPLVELDDLGDRSVEKRAVSETITAAPLVGAQDSSSRARPAKSGRSSARRAAARRSGW